MSDTPEHDQTRLDALRELGTMGSGRATSALAQMTGHKVMLDVPQASIVQADELAAALSIGAAKLGAVRFKAMGDITGSAVLLFPETDLLLLADLLLHRAAGTTREISEMERSSIEEVGNVAVGAYLNGLSDFLGMMSMPSVPSLMSFDTTELARRISPETGQRRDIVVSISNRFEFDDYDPPFGGHFVFLPDAPTLKFILRTMQLD